MTHELVSHEHSLPLLTAAQGVESAEQRRSRAAAASSPQSPALLHLGILCMQDYMKHLREVIPEENILTLFGGKSKAADLQVRSDLGVSDLR